MNEGCAETTTTHEAARIRDLSAVSLAAAAAISFCFTASNTAFLRFSMKSATWSNKGARANHKHITHHKQPSVRCTAHTTIT